MSTDCTIERAIFVTPLGWAGAAVSEQGLCAVVLPKKDKKAIEREVNNAECWMRSAERTLPSNCDLLQKTIKLLQRYLSGERVSFDLPLDMRYHTSFQRAVWKAASEIPYGETQSYAWLAKRIKNPKAARAVGQALGANPIPIIIP